MFAQLGSSLLYFFDEVGLIIRLFFKVVYQIITGRLHWRNFKEEVVHLGYDSLPIILLTAFFIGMVFAMQITKEFVKYGGGSVVGGVIGIAFWRELSPVLSGVIIAGRVGAAIAARLGSMKVTEQIDAIKTFGVDEVAYLVTPKVAAVAFILPLAVIFFDVIGIIGSYFMSVKVMGLNSMLFYSAVKEMPDLTDLLGGVIKAVFFGAAIALISCQQGMETKGGALGVGIAATKAVVISLLTIFVLNYFLSLIIFK